MQRFLSFAFGAVLVALFAMPALAADSGAGMPGMPGGMMKGDMAMPRTCPSGQAWIKGYKKKSGAMVKGYCRKAPAVKASAAAPTK